MVILSKNGAQYRTQTLARERAEQFASCLRANPLFDGVMVYESSRAKHPERRWYVVYHPASGEAQQNLLNRQEDLRAAKAEAEGQHYLFVEDERTGRFYYCLSKSGEVYEVNLFDCSCPDHSYRCRAAGIRCKHRIALEVAHERGDIQTF